MPPLKPHHSELKNLSSCWRRLVINTWNMLSKPVTQFSPITHTCVGSGQTKKEASCKYSEILKFASGLSLLFVQLFWRSIPFRLWYKSAEGHRKLDCQCKLSKQVFLSLPPPTLLSWGAKIGAEKLWTKFSPAPAVQSITSPLWVQPSNFLGHDLMCLEQWCR